MSVDTDKVKEYATELEEYIEKENPNYSLDFMLNINIYLLMDKYEFSKEDKEMLTKTWIEYIKDYVVPEILDNHEVFSNYE